MAMALLEGSESWTEPVPSIVMLVPAQDAPFFPPVRMSQYVPALNPVLTAAETAVVSRLIATNPLSPREKAIASRPLSHQ
jgi:hypothetical protein